MSDITLCLTIGRRPELLKETLHSLLHRYKFKEIIAINDFRDPPTNEVFRSICPDGLLISLDKQLGHHNAVDYMYSKVSTPYVLHCEDDWLFDQNLNIEKALNLIRSMPSASQVCFRKVSDHPLDEKKRKEVVTLKNSVSSYSRLDGTHSQWHGYTFNPHLIKLELWKNIGGFSKFEKERHISRHLRSKGFFSVYIEPGACYHIGDKDSVSHKPSYFRLFKQKFKQLF